MMKNIRWKHIRGKGWEGLLPLYHWAILPWTAEAGFEPATGRLTVEVTLPGASDMWDTVHCCTVPLLNLSSHESNIINRA